MSDRQTCLLSDTEMDARIVKNSIKLKSLFRLNCDLNMFRRLIISPPQVIARSFQIWSPAARAKKGIGSVLMNAIGQTTGVPTPVEKPAPASVPQTSHPNSGSGLKGAPPPALAPHIVRAKLNPITSSSLKDTVPIVCFACAVERFCSLT